MQQGFRLGIDVGGTFTDAILIDEKSGEINMAKVLSTPKDPSEGFLSCLDAIESRYDLDLKKVWLLVHGTTVATNSIIEGKTSPTALIVTRGFRDILEIAYQIRPKLYDVFVEKPTPLVPRDCCFEMTERIGPTGEVLTELKEDEVVKVSRIIKEKNIETVAICLLHSYLNDSHEKRVFEILSRELPDLLITLSSVISPEFREYPRASTTCINACIRPIVSRYVDKIEKGISARGVKSHCYLMQSNGGIVNAEITKSEPMRIIESGPAAGIIVGAHVASQVAMKNAICLDIGGTTAKIGIVLEGKPQISSELEVGAAAFSRSTASRASGYPLRTPSIDLVEIGAGGGSIAWVDSGGILRVGPQSAGADPGPACYPSGGKLPTLTDANVILGRLNPDFFLGGKMQLSAANARDAMQEHCCDKLNTALLETAAGVIRVAIANMVNAIRFQSVEKGYDPREFCLIVTGGAGPLHANLIADEIGIPNVIVPPIPGVASAIGLLISDIKQEAVITVLTIKDFNEKTARKIIDDLAGESKEQLDKQGVREEEQECIVSADMRYAGQSYEMSISLENANNILVDFKDWANRFHKEHRRAYGFCNESDVVELVNLRVTGIGKMPQYDSVQIASGQRDPKPQAKGRSRDVYFEKLGKSVNCEVYDRQQLQSNNIITGPAIIEEIVSTTVLLPDYQAQVDAYGNLIIEQI